MKQESYAKMLMDGKDITSVLNRAPEDKRFLASIMAETFINGTKTQEQLTAARSSG